MEERSLASALVDIARASTRDLSLHQMLHYAAGTVLDATEASGVSMLIDAGGHQPLQASTHEVYADLLSLELEVGHGPCLDAHRSGEEVPAFAKKADGRSADRRAAAALEVGATLGVPLRVDGRQLGAFVLHLQDAAAMSPAARRRIRVLADVLAAYLYSARERMQSSELVEVLQDRALHDPVTGAANRWLLHDRLNHAVERSQRRDHAVGVLFIDVDHMKAINDRYGHATGDSYLRLLVERISALLRPEDTLARLAGDEFVVICEHLSSVAQAEEVADRVLEALLEPLGLSGAAGMPTTVSIGIALAGQGPRAAEDALARADAAMYAVKRRGGAARQTAAPAPGPPRPYAVPDVG